MRLSTVLGSAFLIACAGSSAENPDACLRFLADLEARGGLVEVCPPDMEFAIVHFDGPPYVASPCLPASYYSMMPDCTTPQSTLGGEAAAICRAVSAFPDQVSLLGPDLRVDASHPAGEWRVRLATSEQATKQRGVLIILPDDSSARPKAILY